MSDELDPYIRRWGLLPDGEPFTTFSGFLQPVRFNGARCMLKVARREKDRRGGELLVWWSGEGAAKVLVHDQRAILMERATGASSLAEMARSGQDDQATRILCDVVLRLNSHKAPFPDQLVPLDQWFGDLPVAAAKYGGTFIKCAAVAADLLSNQNDFAPLHGDIHHGNVLDFGDRGWLAIDPKGLIGERGFAYA